MGCNGCKDESRVKMQIRRERRRRRMAAAAARGSVQRRVKKLQRLIPGGRGLKPDRLLLRTADYILHLRLQVNVLQTLSDIYKP
ncbi:Transcription factor IBH1 [Camellia lanceoleosa]|uniref:Transcription factor IBH1 n=1 Tax=Camellia lanceoleosa TaxID=1840588 RepID=A0ACC0GDQ9_9ERIC|nr:Transcription factor IBH1 [Camellia lanceoleosa]